MGRRKGRLSHFQDVEQPQVNLTPLIDVVFVILIMFIVVAPLLELDKVELAEGPHDGMHSAHDKGPITIHVRQDNTLWLNEKPTQMGALTEFLVLAKRQYPTAVPQLYHDRKAHLYIPLQKWMNMLLLYLII